MKTLTINQALEIMKNKDIKRYPHIYSTYKKALELSKRYHLDEYKVAIAAILHDYAKNEPLAKLVKYLDKSLLKYHSAIYHGEVGSILLQEELGINDQDIILAVKYHVTGHPNMNDTAKTVYIADFIEETRKHDGVDFCRYASNISLDVGVLAISESIYNHLKNKDFKIHPLTYETYQHFLKKVGDKTYESIKSNYQSLR